MTMYTEKQPNVWNQKWHCPLLIMEFHSHYKSLSSVIFLLICIPSMYQSECISTQMNSGLVEQLGVVASRDPSRQVDNQFNSLFLLMYLFRDVIDTFLSLGVMVLISVFGFATFAVSYIKFCTPKHFDIPFIPMVLFLIVLNVVTMPPIVKILGIARCTT